MNSFYLRIETPPPTHTVEALRLVFSDLSEADRIEVVKEHLDVPGDFAQCENLQKNSVLLGCYHRDRLLGAVLAQVQEGRTAVVWPPRIVADAPEEIAESLLDAAGRQLALRRICLANVLLEKVSEADEGVLRHGGYEPLAELLYVFCPQDDLPAVDAGRPQDGSRMEFEPYCRANHNRMVHIIEKTYEKTLDCPRLGGVRRIEDVLQGYRHTGRFDPSHWLIVRHQGEDVGCLLLADHPDHDNMELVYMGVIASARGHGWGKEIAQYAKWLTAVKNRSRLVLAVDAENRPALDMYAAVGFRVWEKRIVYAKLFR